MSSWIRRKARRMIHREKQGRRRELQKLQKALRKTWIWQSV
jgi:hypothetical protein